MNRIAMRISVAVVAASAWGLVVAPVSLADTGCSISGNGAHSINTCSVTIKKGHKKPGHPTQVNSASIVNGVNVVSNTGGNRANSNTGGTVSVNSGSSTVNVTIRNTVNSNFSSGATP